MYKGRSTLGSIGLTGRQGVGIGDARSGVKCGRKDGSGWREISGLQIISVRCGFCVELGCGFLVGVSGLGCGFLVGASGLGIGFLVGAAGLGICLHPPLSRSIREFSLQRITVVSIAAPHEKGYCLLSELAITGPVQVHDINSISKTEFATNDGQLIIADESLDGTHDPIAVSFFKCSIHMVGGHLHIESMNLLPRMKVSHISADAMHLSLIGIWPNGQSGIHIVPRRIVNSGQDNTQVPVVVSIREPGEQPGEHCEPDSNVPTGHLSTHIEESTNENLPGAHLETHCWPIAVVSIGQAAVHSPLGKINIEPHSGRHCEPICIVRGGQELIHELLNINGQRMHCVFSVK
jgi:hypothetical protein